MSWVANLIWVLHMAFCAWVALVPFTDLEPMLVLHLFIIPFLWLHWATNQNTCALTLIEKRLRGITDDDKSFFFNLVAPIYTPDDVALKHAAWMATLVLWSITLWKVMRRPAMIREVLTGTWRPVRATTTASET